MPYPSPTTFPSPGTYPGFAGFPDGKFVITNPSVVIDGTDLSYRCRAIAVNQTRDEIEITSFNTTGYREYMPGIAQTDFTLELFSDFSATATYPSASTYPSSSTYPSTPVAIIGVGQEVLIEVTPKGLPAAINNPKWSAYAMIVKHAPLTGQVGDPAMETLELHSTGELFETYA
jgi:hypothetical protein